MADTLPLSNEPVYMSHEATQHRYADDSDARRDIVAVIVGTGCRFGSDDEK